jgi:CheY-like chemotaxis protein
MPNVLRTLFVEDEPDVRRVVEMALSRNGTFKLTCFDNGAEASDVLETKDLRFDVALVNIQLPAMTGIQFVERLHAIPPHEEVPIIFLTASPLHLERQEMEKLNARGVISKPFSVLRLEEQILELLNS